MRIEEKEGKLQIVDFNELEAYKIASKIEQDGISFYQNLVNGVKDESARGKLKYLLEEEKKHLNFFQGCLSKAEEKIEDGFEEDDLLKYMDYGIFQPYEHMNQMKDIIDDVAKALDIGIIVEDRTVKFYQACKDKLTSKEARQEIQNIISEEQRHKELLLGMLSEA
ncbi:ferritin family protein [Candidatus Omnitrophota bacterium]